MSALTFSISSLPNPIATAGLAPDKARLERWRLVLGSQAEESCGELSGVAAGMDKAMAALYDQSGDEGLSRRGGRGRSAPNVARWLGDIRKYFPSTVVQVMQRDAMERLNLNQMMLEPEMLELIQPDIHMVANLVSLAGQIPSETKETARMVVRKVCEDLMRQLEEPMRAAITGALSKSQRNRRPRHSEIDWGRTIRANLRHYQADFKTIVPETLIGYGRKAKKPQRELVICIDQSGSMMQSVIYSSIFAAVMASLPMVTTKLVMFDTEVVDMTEKLEDPVDVLFGIKLGGGTDINRAVGYCQSLMTEPRNTIMVLISDLYEGGVQAGLLRRAAEIIDSGAQLIVLLALSDEGKPSYDRSLASKLAGLGVASFACTPDAFPSMMAAAIKREDVSLWAAQNGIVTAAAGAVH